jgi:HlyD family secretion protein
MKLKLIFAFVLVLIIAGAGYKYFSTEKELPYDFALAERGEIVQKVSATGQIMPAKRLNLQYEIQGKIENIWPSVGDTVKAGQILARLNSDELSAQVLEAKASRDIAKAKLNKLLAGATPEEIKIKETTVENTQIAIENAQVTLKNAEQNLTDTKTDAQNDLDQVYQDALNTLDSAYLKIYNAYNAVDLIQKTYFGVNDQEGIKVRENKEYKIKEPMDEAKTYLDTAKTEPTDQNIDAALSEMKEALSQARNGLANIREVCEDPVYRDTVSSADKTSLDNHKSYINTALTNVTNDQQAISSTKLTNESNINTAQSSVDSAKNAVKTAQGNLKSAQDQLAQIKASPREEDVALNQAQLDQTEASLTRAKKQLSKASLISPCGGIITDITKEEGEQVSTAEAVVSIICKGKFQIEVDIPEADIGKVSLQNLTNISLDAFPEEVFPGKVVKIDPAETIIQGVVYYKVTVGFDEANEGIKSGMTADVDIITETREKVLRIPQRAVLTKNGKKIVRILNDEKIKEIEVETGNRGSEGEIEIVSGLKEGDKIITFVKQK